MWRAILGSTLFAALAVAGLLAVYYVAFGTHRGFDIDANAFDARAAAFERPDVTRVGNDVLNTISVTSLALLGGTAIVMALIWRGLPSALAIMILVGASSVTTQVLKQVVPEPDPFEQGLVREFSGTFPSGHATVAMSLAIAFVFATPPWLKGLVGLGGTGYAVVIGVLLVLLGSHYPSDVVGGYLVAAVWAGYSAFLGVMLGPSIGRRIHANRHPEFSSRVLASMLLGPAALFAGVAAYVVYREPDVFSRGRLSAEFVASAAGIAATAGLVVLAAMWLPRGARLLTPVAPVASATPGDWPRQRKFIGRGER
jgi:membrane-associated phospholipid phosphatase